MLMLFDVIHVNAVWLKISSNYKTGSTFASIKRSLDKRIIT